MRESRNKVIEAEVEIRRVRAERDRVQQAVISDEKESQAKLDDLARVKRKLLQQKEELKAEVAAQQRDVKARFD